MENWVSRGVAAAGLAWLALTGIVYLMVFVGRRRREHGWLAAQSLLLAAFPLRVLAPWGEPAILGAVLAIGAAASVGFTHAHFALRRPSRLWIALTCIGVGTAVLSSGGLAGTLLVIAAAVTHQIEALWRLSRGTAAPLNARLLLGAWIALAAALVVDGAGWLVLGRAVAEPEHLGATLLAVTTLAFIYTVALVREQETRSREIESLNVELRRQIALRSRQLGRALARGTRPNELKRGREIGGRYTIVDDLGSGGMGVVHEVIRSTDGKRFALKLLHGRAVTAASSARFAREAEILAQLDHPNLVSIADVDVTDDGQLFIVMELVAGTALDSAAGAGPRAASWCVDVLGEIAAGLAAIHDAGVIHRDLKPSNILVSCDERDRPQVKIADFGVASFHAPTATPLTETGVVMGTPRYMAPEIVTGARGAGFAVDVFAFGVMAYELLSGQPPFHDGPAVLRAFAMPAPSLADRVPGLAPELVALVHDCLAFNGNERPSAASLVARLRGLPPMSARTAVPGPAAERPPTSPTVPYES